MKVLKKLLIITQEILIRYELFENTKVFICIQMHLRWLPFCRKTGMRIGELDVVNQSYQCLFLIAVLNSETLRFRMSYGQSCDSHF